jgi:hypothetical protein
MSQYLLSVYQPADFAPAPDVMQEMFAAVDKFNAKLQSEGAWVFAGGLHPADTATVVQVKDGETLMTDGPFGEAKEHVGGFWIIEAADLDAALGWAREGAAACQGSVEVRPFQDEPPVES